MKFGIIAGVVVIVLGLIIFLMTGEEDTVTNEIDITPPTDQLTDDSDLNDLDVIDDGSAEENAFDADTAENPMNEDENVIGEERVFNLDSFRFGYSEDLLVVKQGDIVTINLTNSDGRHDIVIDEFNVASEIIGEGEETSVTFIADQVGEFEFYCSVGSHREQGMVGTLIVEA